MTETMTMTPPGASTAMPSVAHQVTIRSITAADEAEFTALSRASRSQHEPWLYLPLDADQFAAYLNRFDQISAFGFVICRVDTGTIVGMVNVSQIVRGSYQRGLLGYGTFADGFRKGYMAAGLTQVIHHCFRELDLHRLEAEIQPGNTASLGLVARLGFRREGFSPELIKIDGVWRDHERWAITETMVAFRPSARQTLRGRV